MARPITIPDPIAMVVHVSKTFREHMQEVAREVSFHSGITVTVSELMRQALYTTYPIGKK